MPKAFIPTMLLPFSGGVKEVSVEAGNVRQIKPEVDAWFPVIKSKLVKDGHHTVIPSLSPQMSRLCRGLAPMISGELRRRGRLSMTFSYQ